MTLGRDILFRFTVKFERREIILSILNSFKKGDFGIDISDGQRTYFIGQMAGYIPYRRALEGE